MNKNTNEKVQIKDIILFILILMLNIIVFAGMIYVYINLTPILFDLMANVKPMPVINPQPTLKSFIGQIIMIILLIKILKNFIEITDLFKDMFKELKEIIKKCK